MRLHGFAALAGVLLATTSGWADVRKGEQAPPAGAAAPQAPPAPPAPPPLPPPPLPPPPLNLPPEMQHMQQRMREEMAKSMGLRVPPPAVKWGGMVLEPAEPVLLEQLNLPADQGMTVTALEAGSPAAAAGLKKHDLLVKVNEQAVPTDARKLLRMLGEVKADTPLDLVVLRKGKEQILKGAKLPQAVSAAPGNGPGNGPLNAFGPGAAPAPPIAPQPLPGVQVQAQVQINEDGASLRVQRTNDRFEGSYSKDKLTITVRGKMDGMQPKAEEITVDNGATKKFDSVDKVPEEQRAAVTRLLQLVNRPVINGVAPVPLPIPVAPPQP